MSLAISIKEKVAAAQGGFDARPSAMATKLRRAPSSRHPYGRRRPVTPERRRGAKREAQWHEFDLSGVPHRAIEFKPFQINGRESDRPPCCEVGQQERDSSAATRRLYDRVAEVLGVHPPSRQGNLNPACAV